MEYLLLPRPRSVTTTGGTVRQLHDAATRTDPAVARPQGYRLHVDAERVELVGHDEAGLRFGRATLGQLQRLLAARGELPAVDIEDWPDFPDRGFMLDVSRDRVPTMDQLRGVVDTCAQVKLNHLELYTEHTFAYAGHETVWRDASPVTPDEVRQLDAAAAHAGVELVPNQNCFGHMERWLKHKAYAHLAEAPDGFTTPWGQVRTDPTTLYPADPASIALVTDMLDQLLPCFTSPRVNVGCDETWDLGQGRSKQACAERGVGRVYLEFLQKVYEQVRRRGRTMWFWADVILHHPDLVGELPEDAVAMVWGYEGTNDFEDQCAKVAAAGRKFAVCPGTSSWCSFAGRTANMLANVTGAAAAGRRHGGLALVNTDWGDQGHLQPWVASLPGLAWGAAVSWCADSNEAMSRDQLAAAVDLHVLDGACDGVAALMMELGDVYLQTGIRRNNSALPFLYLVRDFTFKADDANAPSVAALEQAWEHAKDLAARAARLPAKGDAGRLLRDEAAYAAALVAAGLEVGLRKARNAGSLTDADRAAIRATVAPLVEQHAPLWRARRREGGRAESVSRLTHWL